MSALALQPLPNEMLVNVLRFVFPEHGKTALVCRQWYAICTELLGGFWNQISTRLCPGPFDLRDAVVFTEQNPDLFSNVWEKFESIDSDCRMFLTAKRIKNPIGRPLICPADFVAFQDQVPTLQPDPNIRPQRIEDEVELHEITDENLYNLRPEPLSEGSWVTVS